MLSLINLTFADVAKTIVVGTSLEPMKMDVDIDGGVFPDPTRNVSAMDAIEEEMARVQESRNELKTPFQEQKEARKVAKETAARIRC